MKKVILGGLLLLSGALGTAILMAGTMAQQMFYSNDEGSWLSFSRTLSSYGLMPALYIFIGLSVAGLVIGCWGLFDKSST